MPNRAAQILWLLLAMGVLLFAGITYAQDGLSPPVGLAVAIVVLITVSSSISSMARLIGLPITALRAHPPLYWFVLLMYVVVAVSRWLVIYQPTNGRMLHSIELAYLCTISWGLLYLLAYGGTADQARAMAAGLGRSRFTGILITLTTIVFLFFAGEAFLRIFYITTDGYGLTAMNYHWYANFGWAQDNSLGYRDHEPLPMTPGLVRIAVVGDSFAMGHGINRLDDTFAQLLEQRLGDCCDVNLLAESGWDTDLELPFLEQYPYTPDIVILSYYLNDIDYLLTDTAGDPNANFSFVQDPTLSWFVLNFFLPNYLYYNLFQFASQQRAAAFVGDLTSAYDNPVYWDEQRFRLNQFVDWAEVRDLPLIVLIWPHIAAIEAARGPVTKVQEVFVAREVPVIDMSPILSQYRTSELIINRFDAHPSVFAHRLAADALEPLVREALAARRAG
jgi:hypothetical protein